MTAHGKYYVSVAACERCDRKWIVSDDVSSREIEGKPYHNCRVCHNLAGSVTHMGTTNADIDMLPMPVYPGDRGAQLVALLRNVELGECSLGDVAEWADRHL